MLARFRVTRGVDARAHECIRIEGDGVVFCPILHTGGLESALKVFDGRIRSLLSLAKRRMPRGDTDVLVDSEILRRNILGDHSFGVHCPFHEYLLLDADEYCATLPWELVSDHYSASLAPANGLIARQGPLALLKTLGVRQGIVAPVAPARDFAPARALVLGSPDYRNTKWKAIGCEEHLREIQQVLDDEIGFRHKYYRVTYKPDTCATRDALLQALEDASYGTIYVFAHGDLKERSIVLAGGDLVSINDLPARLRGAPFIFLNICWGARDTWTATSGTSSSFANEFLRRGASCVVAPLCPVLNTQAAQAAVGFFREAVGTTVGRAMEHVRRDSHKLYEEDREPDMSWFAYRVYGDPQSCLPTRAWTSDGSLVGAAFTPEVGRLFRAMQATAEERGDDQSTVGDLFTGLAHLTATAMSIPLPHLPPWLGGVARKAPDQAAGRKIPLTAGEREPKPETEGIPDLATPRPVRTADRFMQVVFRNVLRLLNARNDAAEKIHMSPPAIGISEMFDQCAVQLMCFVDWKGGTLSIEDAIPENIVAEIRRHAAKEVQTLVSELHGINKRFTSGAAFLLQRIEVQARFCRSRMELEAVVLDAFLDHFLVGHTVLRGRTKEVGHLREVLSITHRGKAPRFGKPEIKVFLDDLLGIAQRKARIANSVVTEQELFLAFSELELRPTPRVPKQQAAEAET